MQQATGDTDTEDLDNTDQYNNNDEYNDHEDPAGASSISDPLAHSAEELKFQRALFLLKAREIHKISQQALNDVMTDFNVMVGGILDNLHSKVKLDSNGISSSDIGLTELFNDPLDRDPFYGLYTEHLRTKYFCEHMHLLVSFCVFMHAQYGTYCLDSFNRYYDTQLFT